MLNQAITRVPETDIVSRLARFFPEATPVRIPIKLSRPKGNEDARPSESRGAFIQDTVIEFGTPHEVLFMVNRPLEFADHVLVESNDGGLHAEASVVAVQYHSEKTVVAVRFLNHVPNWILKS